MREAQTAGISDHIAELRKELLADNVKPVGIRLYTADPDLVELLSAPGTAGPAANADPLDLEEGS